MTVYMPANTAFQPFKPASDSYTKAYRLAFSCTTTRFDEIASKSLVSTYYFRNVSTNDGNVWGHLLIYGWGLFFIYIFFYYLSLGTYTCWTPIFIWWRKKRNEKKTHMWMRGLLFNNAPSYPRSTLMTNPVLCSFFLDSDSDPHSHSVS